MLGKIQDGTIMKKKNKRREIETCETNLPDSNGIICGTVPNSCDHGTLEVKLLCQYRSSFKFDSSKFWTYSWHQSD